jgi:ribosome-binding protein aMBF1 (putative translation factor)
LPSTSATRKRVAATKDAVRALTPSQICDIARLRYGMSDQPHDDTTIERLRQRLSRVGDDGWFFARIAEQVAERRRELGLSQKQLAELTGTTQSAIARLESGGRPPRIDTLLRITSALDCELEVNLRPRTKGDGP